MDVSTIINLLAIGNLISSVIFLSFIYSYKNKNPALNYFTAGKILQTITWIFFIYYQNNLTPTIMIIGNTFQYLGLTFEVYGFTYIFNKKNTKILLYWILTCCFFLSAYIAFSSNTIYRVFISSLLFFCLYIFMFIRLVFSKDHSKTQLIVGWISLIFGLIHISRGLFGLVTEVELHIYNNTIIQVITGYIYIITTFTFPIFLLLIIIEKDNKQLKELNSTKNKFFRIISHDLKSPIIQLISIAEIIDLKKGNMGINELEELGIAIKNSSIRTSKLLDDLLNWAQSQSNTISIKQEIIIVRENIHENIELYREKLKEKNIKVVNNISDSNLVYCDNNMLNLIIRNLLSNAIKFSFINGTIDISCKCNDQFCTIMVKDEGIGINKNNINKLFKIESNYTTLGTSDEVGSGIGLTLCKEFIEKNNGEIWVESTENKGTIFFFSLPIPN